MARMLLSVDDGSFFNEDGTIHRNLPIEYIKAQSWELRPRIKGPAPPEVSTMFIDEANTQEDGESLGPPDAN